MILAKQERELNTIADIEANRNLIASAAGHMKDMLAEGAVEAECPVTHRFTDGCYLREIFMPKGTIIIGKIHATEHFNIILKGDVTVLTVEGAERITAPHTFISKAGVQKVVIMHEDCIWQTVHVTDKTDLNDIEKEVVVDDYDNLKVDGIINKYIKGLS